MKRLLTARFVAPMDGTGGADGLLRDAGVVIEHDRIVAVGLSRTLRREHPDAQVEDLGDSVILPGLVNAHTHLEWSDVQRQPPPAGGLIEWLNQRRADRTDQQVRRAVEIGVRQCLRFGVTAVGDISKFFHITRPMLASSPLRVVSYGEIIALGKKRDQLAPLLDGVSASQATGCRLRIGISPHAPYTVEAAGYRKCLEVARQRHLPLATHLAESEHEQAFLANHAGPFRDLWERIGLWDAPRERFAGGPVKYARALGLLDHPALLAHVNYCDDEDLSLLAAGRASVVYCPRTHAHFSHPPHRWRQMLSAGVNVAVGTDSCASSPDLNLVDDLRLLHRLHPEAPCHVLWELATRRGAQAINLEDAIGTLTPGKYADLVIFPCGGDHPLRDILDNPVLPAQTLIAGQRVDSSST